MTIKYIYGDNLELQKPPFAHDFTSMYAFIVKGDADALQKIIDTNLNAVAGEKVYTVKTNLIIQTFVRTKYSGSCNPDDKVKGYEEETEAIPWILVENKHKEELFLFPYVCFVNSALALNTGRGYVGYPKYIGGAKIPEMPDPEAEFNLSVKSYKFFNKEAKLASHPLMKVQPKITEEPLAEKVFDSIKHFFHDCFDILKHHHSIETDIKELFDFLKTDTVNQIMLKQLPAANGIDAVYQAVMKVPAKVKRSQSPKYLGHDYVMTIVHNDSFPIADSLGIKVNEIRQVEVLASFYVEFDFEVELGEVLHDAFAQNETDQRNQYNV